MNEQLAVAPDKAKRLQELMQTTKPGSPEEAAILQEMRDARKEAHAETTGTIVNTLEERKDTGELLLPRTEAQHLAHLAIEKATSGEMPVPTEAELADVSAQMGLEQTEPEPPIFDQEKH